MDPQVSGSFIPKAPLAQTSRRAGIGLVLLFSILLFVLSLVSAAGVFAYTELLKAQITSRDEQLALAEGAFEPRVIEDLSRLDTRLIRTRELLNRHLAPSAVFDFLSTATLERVQFTSFEYRTEASGAAQLRLVGAADSYSTVALQSDQFGSARLLKNVVFSDVAVSENNRVTFTVQATLDPTLYLYARQERTSAPVVVPQEQAQQTTP